MDDWSEDEGGVDDGTELGGDVGDDDIESDDEVPVLGLDGGEVGVVDPEEDEVPGSAGKSVGRPLIIAERRPRGDCPRIVTLSSAVARTVTKVEQL